MIVSSFRLHLFVLFVVSVHSLICRLSVSRFDYQVIDQLCNEANELYGIRKSILYTAGRSELQADGTKKKITALGKFASHINYRRTQLKRDGFVVAEEVESTDEIEVPEGNTLKFILY